MSVIKQISIFNGSNWEPAADIGANAENIDFTYTTGSQQGNTAALSSILPAQVLTASRVLTTDSNGKLSSSNISSGVLNTALTGASTVTSLQSQINTLNTNFNNPTIGSWTPSIPRANISNITGQYINFGKIIYCHCSFTFDSNQTNQGNLFIDENSFPTIALSKGVIGTGIIQNFGDIVLSATSGNSNVWLSKAGDRITATSVAGKEAIFTFIYLKAH